MTDLSAWFMNLGVAYFLVCLPTCSRSTSKEVRVSEFSLRKKNKHLRESHLHLLLGTFLTGEMTSFRSLHNVTGREVVCINGYEADGERLLT